MFVSFNINDNGYTYSQLHNSALQLLWQMSNFTCLFNLSLCPETLDLLASSKFSHIVMPGSMRLLGVPYSHTVTWCSDLTNRSSCLHIIGSLFTSSSEVIDLSNFTNKHGPDPQIPSVRVDKCTLEMENVCLPFFYICFLYWDDQSLVPNQIPKVDGLDPLAGPQL